MRPRPRRTEGDDKPPREAKQRTRQTSLWMLLFGAVLAVVVPSVVLTGDARVFALKLFAAGIMAFLPGWIYLQFIRNKGVSLYDEYVLNLFRLRIDRPENLPSPPEHTSYFKPWEAAHKSLGTETKDNLYRRKFEGVYGRSAVSTYRKVYGARRRVRDKTETFSPVLFATLLLCLAWVLVLQPEPLDWFGEGAESSVIDLPYEALKFGFFGSYFFIIQDLLRRYYREDLKTVAYISASARIVFVAVIVTGIAQIWEGIDGDQKAIAFLIGVFPQLGLQVIRLMVEQPLRDKIPSLETKHPLSDIDGLSYWYEARLLEEGIEDIQNLASANLVDLMLRTRVPIARLMDWIDQGFLHLHLPHEEGTDTAWRRFHDIGIRGATDLQRAWAELGDDEAFVEKIRHALKEDSVASATARMKMILLSLEGAVNLTHVAAFKDHDWLDEPDEHGKADGEADGEAVIRVPEEGDTPAEPAANGQPVPTAS